MNKEMKNCLKQAYEPPKPIHKEEFLQQISAQTELASAKLRHAQSISRKTFLLQQAGYIRKRVWVISVLFFVGALLAGSYIEKESLWEIAAVVPFLAFVTVTEGLKSITCHMEELEMSARYSMRDVVMSRLVILGVCNFVLLFLIGLNCCIVLFVPYLLTATLELYAIRKVRSREVVYLCMGIAVCVSGLQLALENISVFIWQAQGQMTALVVMFLLLIGLCRECIYTMKLTEEYVWN